MGAPAESRPLVTLIIVIQAGGRVDVTGPIDQKMLCYGMLEAARDQIKDFKVEAPTIIHPIL